MASSKLGLDTVEGEQNNEYVFSSGGYSASARLNLQYFLFGWQTGFQISPLVPTNKENLMIADVGTGSGIWPVELSSKLPSATIDAFDVTKNLIPRAEWLPSNVHFHHLDVFEPVPAEYIGKYDVVHIRFFAPVLGKTGPEPVVKFVLQMLKPGGILQWDERETSFRISENGASKSGGSQATQSLSSSIQVMFKIMGHDLSWITRLDEVFDSGGLVDVKKEQYSTPNEMHAYQMDLFFQTLEEASIGMDRMRGKGEGDELRTRVAAAYEEHRLCGSLMEADTVVCVGRKAH
ncbi:hypothetical protein L207DRAFT_636950 [Hyaloscypha variabilis F]|uniref:S-adenosyl-L-methionine-dependent methyltransferase n=1 Tax=Hyaloscypha variabilis (strain UAMH 11265 / GT02V1 / F) TaxID=1149755 RepID=A0A2J6RF07_HYAVF|nr:hypothetical protein L207DRAFT_636950 [Hyaloscypha variabilis F]